MQTEFYLYRPTALLRLTGEDVFSFLQGQFTNDLQHPAGRATYGLWLNQKGKVLADSVVLRVAAAEFFIVSVNSGAAQIRERLDAYIIADDVVIEDATDTARGVVLVGPGSRDLVERLAGRAPLAGEFVTANGVMIFASTRSGAEGFELIGSEDALKGFAEPIATIGAVELTVDELSARRIEAGVPAIPIDIGVNDLPNEGGLETRAISYTKGCYLGQEVMARLKNLGQVRRKLHVIRGAGSPPVIATALYQGAEKVGEVRSAAARGEGFVAMAMLSLVKLNPQLGLSLAPGSEPVVEIVARG